MSTSIGARIRAAREAAGLSRLALARYSGVCQDTVRLLENDKTLPRYRTLAAIARATGTTVDALDPHHQASGHLPYRIARVLDAAGQMGLTRNQLRSQITNGSRNAAAQDAALAPLLAAGTYEHLAVTHFTDGVLRTTRIYRRRPDGDT